MSKCNCGNELIAYCTKCGGYVPCRELKEETVKTCNIVGYCSYKTIGCSFAGCNYTGYCDYQAPKDSRVINPFIDPLPPYQQCTCGTSSSIPCPVHGGGHVKT